MAMNKVEIVENKPLARTLYANVEIGEVIPPELYQAVADVLAFVYKLQGKIYPPWAAPASYGAWTLPSSSV